MDVTTDFIYCRLHGPAELYASGYDEKALGFWRDNIACWAAGGEPHQAERIGSLAKPRKGGRDVFVFFDNDLKVLAPHDAAALMQLLGLHRHLEEDERVTHEAKKAELKTSAGRQVKNPQAGGCNWIARSRRFQPGDPGEEQGKSSENQISRSQSRGAVTRLFAPVKTASSPVRIYRAALPYFHRPPKIPYAAHGKDYCRSRIPATYC